MSVQQNKLIGARQEKLTELNMPAPSEKLARFSQVFAQFQRHHGVAIRAEPQAINQALNRPRAKLGLDLTAWMAIVFVCIAVFLVGFRFLAMMAFPALATAAWLIIRRHPKMFQLWGRGLNQKSYYDPRKR